MAKVKVYIKISVFIAVMLSGFTSANAQYRLVIEGVDKPSSFFTDTLKLKTSFPNNISCVSYVNKLTALVQSKGYPSASIDSLVYDSLQAYCVLFVGEIVRYANIDVKDAEPGVLDYIGWNRKGVSGRTATLFQFGGIQEKILTYKENNGYPFASIAMDSIRFAADSVYGRMKIDNGPVYHIDSIRNYGTASISSNFLQQYLGIRNGSIYRKDKLRGVSKKISELPFLQEKQPWNLTLLGTGSVLNVYLDTKKSSEINVLLGLLPSNSQLTENKLLVTGEATINLKNPLGNGETIGLNWQQLQVRSPRLNILFQQPYLFSSPFGVNFNFDLFKKDSSFVNISILLGAAYAVSANKTGSVFVQQLTTNLLTVDSFAVKSSRRLPAEADISSTNIGINYEIWGTDYRYNPRKGNEFSITAAAGTKTIKKNNVIIKLSDNTNPSFDYNSLYDTFKLKSYQFRVKFRAAHYFPVTRASTVRMALSGGWFQSPNVFRNELFQIGGYKLLRGFDEESIFCSAYGVASAEYRYLLSRNSYLFSFVDFGIANNNSQQAKTNNNFLGAGLGMAFETKAGIFNISYAAGKRDDQKFNLRQSKIHLGYVNYF